MSLFDLVEERFAALEKRQKEILDIIKISNRKPEDNIYDNSAMQRLLFCSPKTLAGFRLEGKISYTQVGAKFYYTESDLQEFLKTNKVNRRQIINSDGKQSS